MKLKSRKPKSPDCIQYSQNGEWYIKQKTIIKRLKELSKTLQEAARIQANQQIQEALDSGVELDVRAMHTLRDDTVHNVRGAMEVVINYFSTDLNKDPDIKECSAN